MPRVLGYALRRTDPEEARDVVAETFTIAWRRLDRIPDGPDALPWLLVTARHVMANRRRSSRPVAVTGPVAVERDHAEDIVGTLALVAAFNRLGERDRETLSLVAWDGLEPGEAARVAGCSSATFSVRLHRARRRLDELISAAESSSWEESR